MYKLNLYNSKNFYGTPALDKAKEILTFLEKYDVRCELASFYYPTHVSANYSDPFHYYNPRELCNFQEFHVIRVHRFDFHEAKLLLGTIGE